MIRMINVEAAIQTIKAPNSEPFLILSFPSVYIKNPLIYSSRYRPLILGI